MLLYLLFWTILGFIFHFYIIFGTNLLTGGPTQNCCFAYFSVSKKQNIKRSPNRMKPLGSWFSNRTWSRRLGPYSKKCPRRSRGWRAPPGGAPYLVASWKLLLRRVQVSWILFVPKITLPKVSFRLDSVWYCVSPNTWNRQKNNNSGLGLRLIG